MHIISFVKKYSVPIRGLQVDTTSNVCILNLTKIKDAMASYLSFSYQTIENVLQELDVVVKNDYASLPFIVPSQKAKSLAKKINEQHQVSLPT